MNTTDPETEIMNLECPYCAAGPGEWCFTPAGFRASGLHSARYYLWRERVDGADQ